MEENKYNIDSWLKDKLGNVQAEPLMSWNKFSALNAGKIPGNKGSSGFKYTAWGAIVIVILAGTYFFFAPNSEKSTVQKGEIQVGEISTLNKNQAIEKISAPNEEIAPQKNHNPSTGTIKSSNTVEVQSEENQEDDKLAMYERMVAESEHQKNANKEQLEKIADELDITLPSEQEFNSGFYVSPGRGESVTLHKPDKFLVSRSRENGILIDLRRNTEFNEGHLRGAVNIEFKVSDFRQKVAKFKREKHIFVYCNDGEVSKSAMALLWKSGFYSVHILQGGVEAWKKANYTLIKN